MLGLELGLYIKCEKKKKAMRNNLKWTNVPLLTSYPLGKLIISEYTSKPYLGLLMNGVSSALCLL